MRFEGQRLFSVSFMLAGAALAASACGSSNPPSDGGAGTGGSSGGAFAMGGSSAAGHAGTGTGGSSAAAAGIGASGGAGGTTTSGGSGGGGTGGAGSGGASAAGGSGGTGGGAGGTAGAASGGAGAGGGAGAPMAGMGGTAGGGAGTGSGGMGGGGSAGMGSVAWTCPSGITDMPMLSGTPKRVASVPPPDDFNMMNGNFGNVEGPVWIGDSLYVSEMSYMAYDQTNSNVKKSRILKVGSDGSASVFIADSGSNGLATDSAGNIVATVHKDGSIKRFALPSGTPTDVVTMYDGARFDSPNDIAVRSDGNIYFSDPDFQAPNTLPQPKTLVYRVPPGGQAEPIPSAASPDNFSKPNGVTLSLAEDYLYVASDSGKRYPVMSDGSLGAGADFAAVSGGDGMTIDCAGNLYVAKANTQNVVVYKPDGTMIGMITVSDVQAATNVAFGGPDHKTLYITGLGNNKGLFSLTLNVPGRPY